MPDTLRAGVTTFRLRNVGRQPHHIADIRVALSDYGFKLSRLLTRCHHRIAITNNASQPHELILARLQPGNTTGDFVHWMEAQDGPPPVTPWGGATDLGPGRTVVIVEVR